MNYGRVGENCAMSVSLISGEKSSYMSQLVWTNINGET